MSTADPQSLAAKSDQAEQIKMEIERKQADGQKALDKRVQELTGPIYDNVGKALESFAKAKGYDMVVDVSKLNGALMVINPTIDLTETFISDYNAKNPLPGTPPKP